MKASVVVPVFNRAALTRRCIDAVLRELPSDCEVIVVDDASTDDTRAVLASYGEAIDTVTLGRNGGYAVACNAGAGRANGEALVFLNNDTEPPRGWLETLLDYLESHPEAAIVGPKLVYPNGAVQHAGVVIGQDGYPHNLYAGFPSEHPAVNRSRRLQAVTGACLLVRREAFDRAGGFDESFVNCFEDVDFCLRIGEEGGETHYCHATEVVHLESASRGRQSSFEQSVDLYRRRWRERVRRDDVEIYAEDRLIEFEYPDSYPIPLSVSPLLATVRSDQREPEVERLLETYARQVADLLQEVVRLTGLLAGRGNGQGQTSGRGHRTMPASSDEHLDFLDAVRDVEEEVCRLQGSLEEDLSGEGATTNGFQANRRLGYHRQVERVREEVSRIVPAGATVLVVSRGDRDLLRLHERKARHFPEASGGTYLGHHPHDSEDAIERLEALRDDGAQYLVVPPSSYWWLEHYADFANHLRGSYSRIDADSCAIYRLGSS